MTTLQRVYDNAISGMKAQRYEKSSSAEFERRGAYHAGDGRKCTIGHSIPESEYRAYIEGLSVVQIFKYHKRLYKKLFGDIRVSILSDLQMAHDTAMNAEQMVSNLNQFAIKNNLVPRNV